MNQISAILNQCVPFIRLMALVFGLMAAWLALVEIIPFASQLWRPKGSAQTNAIVAAALAIVAGGR